VRWCRARYPSLFLIAIDEYLTSQVCPRCWEVRDKATANARIGPRGGNKQRSHKVLVCPGQCTPFFADRDMSAAQAIAARAIGELFPDARRNGLASFARPAQRPRQVPRPQPQAR
jgi:transposase